MPPPFVRPYNAAHDFEAGLHVFFTTIDSNLDWEPARTIGSYLWFRPYVHLSPETCLVLDDGTGRVVGYCIGAANTAIFAQRWRQEFAPLVNPDHVPHPSVKSLDPLLEKQDIRHFRNAVYTADCSMLQAFPALLDTFPAHMHIDVLPEYQRKGWGRVLITSFFQAVKASGARGLHLDMLRSNTGAKAFYQKMGFQMCRQVLDDGKSGEVGVNGVVMTLVKVL